MMSLVGIENSNLSRQELVQLYNEYLENGMHGLCASPYVEGQKPGEQLTEEQIRRRIEIIKPYTKWLRSFSCTEGNELIPKIAKEYLKIVKGKKISKSDVNKVIDFVKNSGGIEYAEKAAKKYSNRASEILSEFKDCPAKESLSEFCDFVINRNK